MSEKSKVGEKEKKAERAPKREKGPEPGALEKCTAVLSIWQERRRPSEVSREYSVPYAVINHWQNRALEGMLQALEPRVRMEKVPALSPRLQALLERKRLKEAAGSRLEERLVRIQGVQKAEKKAS
jgi:hypothetical protein